MNRQYSKGSVHLLFLLMIILFAAVLSGGLAALIANPDAKTSTVASADSPNQLIPVFQPQPAKNSLQLMTMQFVTPTPTVLFSPAIPIVDFANHTITVPIPTSHPPTTGGCIADGPTGNGQCCAGVGFGCITTSASVLGASTSKQNGSANSNKNTGNNKNTGTSSSGKKNGNGNNNTNMNKPQPPQCAGANTPQTWCDAKPVLYLYPQKPTTVSVKLTVPGTIAVSTPLYPDNGWQHIQASPDGSFLYKGEKYHELFYEAALTHITPPAQGIVVSMTEVRQTLFLLATQLGLLPQEQDELVDYWLPRLQTLHSPYLFISYFSPEEKKKIDQVTITPNPDTFLQYILYFKPLQHKEKTIPLSLPLVPPVRKGFVVVEWGGVFDTISK